jgi:hypothetical protein
MRTKSWLLLLPFVPAVAVACSNDVSIDNIGDPASNVQPLNGAISGSVTYTGPRPCSQNGQIVGNAIILVFDRRNPPPPAGLAVTAVNLAVVDGGALFPNEPRFTGSQKYCPVDHGFTETINVTAPFSVGPLAPASYLIQAFFDYTGDFLPNFKFRQLPEKGDIAGGAIDVADALKAINQGNPNYTPIYQAIDVGIPQPLEAGAPPGTIPLYTLPSNGFVAENVQVTLGVPFTTTRPYFYAQGMTFAAGATSSGFPNGTLTEAQSSDVPLTPGKTTGIQGSVDINDPNYAPILTIPQDIQTYAPPTDPLQSLQAGANSFEQGGKSPATGITYSGLPHLRLVWGAGAAQATAATSAPFNMQILPFKPPTGGGFNVWRGEWLDPDGVQLDKPDAGPGPSWQGQYIPEGWPVPFLWPLIVLSKLEDDPGHMNDPASITAQGDANHPVIIMQGITLAGGSTVSGNTDGDSLFGTSSTVGLAGAAHSAQALGQMIDTTTGLPNVTQQDHVTVLVRQAAFCFNSLFDANNSNKHGQIVTPYLTSESADYNGFTSPPTPTPKANTPIVPLDLLTNNDPSRFQASTLMEAPAGWKPGTPPAVPGCLPRGRYAINVVYPDGQAWTVPNEAGACTGDASGEGHTIWNQLTCSMQPRPVIRSQGPRAVVEIVGPSNPKNCKVGAPVPPVPAMCCYPGEDPSHNCATK